MSSGVGVSPEGSGSPVEPGGAGPVVHGWDPAGSAIGEAYDRVVGVLGDDLSTVSDAGVRDQFEGLLSLKERVDAALAVTAGVFHQRGCSQAEVLSTRDWTAFHGHLVGADAHRLVRTGVMLAKHHSARAALVTGELRAPDVTVLAGATGGGRDDLFDAKVDDLVVALTRLTGEGGKVEDLATVVGRWKTYADEILGKGEPDGGYRKRRLSLAATIGGMLSVNGHLDQAGGTVAFAALEHLAQKKSKDDARTHPERLADAFIELCESYVSEHNGNGAICNIDVTIDADTLAHLFDLNHDDHTGHGCPDDPTGDNPTGDEPTAGDDLPPWPEPGEDPSPDTSEPEARPTRDGRPTPDLSLFAPRSKERPGGMKPGPYDVLAARTKVKESLDWLLMLSPSQILSLRRDHAFLGVLATRTLRVLLERASIGRAVLGADREVLDLGRRVRHFNRAQRRASRLHYGGCHWLGCNAPVSWIELHHVEHWENGGTTDLVNCLPFCGCHHTYIHKGWRLEPDEYGILRPKPPPGRPSAEPRPGGADPPPKHSPDGDSQPRAA